MKHITPFLTGSLLVLAQHAFAAGKVVEVGVKKDGPKMLFSPAELSIEKGTTVRWINNDPSKQLHNIISGKVTGKSGKADGKFKSPMLTVGKSFEHTFNESGEFEYFCQPHIVMGMHGKVTVK